MTKRIILSTAFLFLATLALFAGDKKGEMPVSEMLMLGPIPVDMPINHETGVTEFNYEKMLGFHHLNTDAWWPKEDDEISVMGKELEWDSFSSSNNILIKNKKNLAIAYFAFYLKADRWTPAELEIKSAQMAKVFLDGKEIASKNIFQKNNGEKCEPGVVKANLKLETGKHIVIVKSLYVPESNCEWNIYPTLSIDKTYEKSLGITLENDDLTDVSDLLNNPKVIGVSINADGSMIAVKITKRNMAEDRNDTWMEIYNGASKKLIRSYKGGTQYNSLKWSPEGDKFSYMTNGKKGASIWLTDMSSGETKAVIENVKGINSYQWNPDGKSIIYSVSEEYKNDDPNFLKYQVPESRIPWAGQESYLFQVFVKDGFNRRLTNGKYSTSLEDISRDGKRLLISENIPDFSERPYNKSKFSILSLEDYSVDSVYENFFGSYAKFSPDGKKILFVGGPSFFGELGKNIPKDAIPNDYEKQLYIYDLQSKAVKPITKNFSPAIASDVFWTEKGLFVVATDETFLRLFKYDEASGEFRLLETGADVIEDIDVSSDGSKAVYAASGTNVPKKAFVMELPAGDYSELVDPDKANYQRTNFGDVKDHSFISEEGREVAGRVYYPPNFDDSKKYPMIVYYYGGALPVTREFEGRYPKNIWAANGYVVYVMQPNGCAGFGQKKASLHVNDWGEITAKEVIEGTKKFIAENDFIDEGKIGCIGASYGGFMTMNIITKTDIFAAAISHAGISALSSYWGEGFWGYPYSAVASANSFPWNNKELYVEHSPLFHADKITTPILLLHGNSDTNVPRGESIQMYVALKILGKDVEFIEVDGQDHHIMEYHKRLKWTKTIMAYFDKVLKGQPEWWNELYK